MLNTFARWDTVLNFQESGTVEKDSNYTHESIRCNITLCALFSDWGCQACTSAMYKLYTSGVQDQTFYKQKELSYELQFPHDMFN